MRSRTLTRAIQLLVSSHLPANLQELLSIDGHPHQHEILVLNMTCGNSISQLEARNHVLSK